MSSSKQIKRYIMIGACTVLVDYLSYLTLLHFGITISVSKACSFLCGASFAFTFHKLFTFESKQFCHKELVKFSTLYFTTLMVNIFSNSLGLLILGWLMGFSLFSFLTPQINITLSFIGATGLTIILNFLGQKFWVFKK